jgi:hypothetical protein
MHACISYHIGAEGGKPLTLLIEVAWLMSYMTHNQEAFHRVIADSGFNAFACLFVDLSSFFGELRD